MAMAIVIAILRKKKVEESSQHTYAPRVVIEPVEDEIIGMKEK